MAFRKHVFPRLTRPAHCPAGIEYVTVSYPTTNTKPFRHGRVTSGIKTEVPTLHSVVSDEWHHHWPTLPPTLNSSNPVFVPISNTWPLPQLIRSPQYVGSRAGNSCYTGRHYGSGNLHTANWCASIGIQMRANWNACASWKHLSKVMSEDEQEEQRAPRGRQSALDQQKVHLQKLMANPVSMHLG